MPLPENFISAEEVWAHVKPEHFDQYWFTKDYALDHYLPVLGFSKEQYDLVECWNAHGWLLVRRDG